MTITLYFDDDCSLWRATVANLPNVEEWADSAHEALELALDTIAISREEGIEVNDNSDFSIIVA